MVRKTTAQKRKAEALASSEPPATDLQPEDTLQDESVEQEDETSNESVQEEVEDFNDDPITDESAEVPPPPAEVIIIEPPAPEPERRRQISRGELAREQMAEASRRRRENQQGILNGGPTLRGLAMSTPISTERPKWETVDLTMNDYLQHMGSNSPIDVKSGASKQRALFMLIKSLLLKQNGKEGQNALFYLLSIINEYRTSHFTPLLWGRFVTQMPGTEAEKQFFRTVMAVLVGVADPKSRKAYAMGIDIDQVISYAMQMESARGTTLPSNFRSFLMLCTRA